MMNKIMNEYYIASSPSLVKYVRTHPTNPICLPVILGIPSVAMQTKLFYGSSDFLIVYTTAENISCPCSIL